MAGPGSSSPAASASSRLRVERDARGVGVARAVRDQPGEAGDRRVHAAIVERRRDGARRPRRASSRAARSPARSATAPRSTRIAARSAGAVVPVERRVEVGGGGLDVATPGVDPAEAQLDRRQPGLVRHGGRRLEGRDRARVVAERRAHLADRELEPDHVRVPEGERGRQVLQRLAVGEHRPRQPARLAVGVRSLGVPARGELVARDLGEAGRVLPAARPQHLRDAPVEQPPPGEPDVLVRGVAQPRVAEVEDRLAAAVHLADDRPPDELLERVDRLVLRPAARDAHRAEVEGAADDRRRGEHLGRGLAHAREAFAEQGTHATRRLVRGPRSRGERLDDVQRQPLRLRGEVAGVPAGRAVARRGDERRDVRSGEPVERDRDRAREARPRHRRTRHPPRRAPPRAT